MLNLEVDLVQPGPYRVFTVGSPHRLVVDVAPDMMRDAVPSIWPRGMPAPERAVLPDGWERLVIPLGRPFVFDAAELRPEEGGAVLRIRLARGSPEEFARRSGVPTGAWPVSGVAQGRDGLVVAVDAGHGGIDPGAVRDGVEEKDIVLQFARALRRHLMRLDGVTVVMLRDDDRFIGLAERVAQARAGGADVLISLHTNADPDPGVAGAIAFTRAERGSSRTAAARALLENAADDRAGLDFLDPEDPVISALSDLARRETDARSEALARALIGALRDGGAGEVSEAAPLQAANFAVLRAPDIPSVLLEIGFLSNPANRQDMLSDVWRDRVAADVARGILAWAAQDSAAAPR